MSSRVPQDREVLRAWLARLHDLLRDLRQLEAQKKQVLSRYRPLIPLRGPVASGDQLLVITAFVGVFIELFYLALGVSDLLTMVIMTVVFVAVAYAVTNLVWKIFKLRRTNEVLVVISGRTFVARQLLATLLVADLFVLIVQFLLFPPVLIAIVTGVAILVGIVVGLFVTAVSKKRAARFNAQAEETNREAKMANASIEQNALAISQRMNELSRELHNEYIGIFPNQYLEENAVGYLLSLVVNYRASTLPEAINLFEEEQHRMRMERGQQQMIEEQHKMQRLQMMSTVINTAMQAATISEIRAQGQSIAAAASAPRTVEIRRG
ncbi:hypothetical protein [Schaalia hyovaginalis]|uniref:hypothetical protein n=1 Tax=Schaalia hyovaginalis TaxID=29316 RepID=UPI0012B1F417|nr:hypothetical protein [Schaalia hyovaginalis]MST63956.1 hypothetical protein [Schaalia hyovaginalis]